MVRHERTRLRRTQRTRGHTSKHRVEFEPAIPVFEWTKTVHLSNSAVTILVTRYLAYNGNRIRNVQPLTKEIASDLYVQPFELSLQLHILLLIDQL